MPGSAQLNVKFFFDKTSISMGSRNELKRFIQGIFKNEKRKLAHVNYIFCTDKRLRLINKQFLGHDYFTDIITFELSESNQPVIAEIYVSVDRVRENAVSHGTNLRSELNRVIFHGALHLCGYNDKTPGQKKRMRIREDFYLSKYSQ